MAKVSMITTNDNPFDPFDNFREWLRYDIEKGYNSWGRVARIANITEDMSEKEIDDETERAIDTLIKYDCLNIFNKKQREEEEI